MLVEAASDTIGLIRKHALIKSLFFGRGKNKDHTGKTCASQFESNSCAAFL